MANEALQEFAPGSTPVGEAGPASLNDYATDLGNQARTKILTNERELKQRRTTSRRRSPETQGSATPILDAARELATGDMRDQVRAAATQAHKRLQGSVSPLDGTISFGTLKTERTTFGSMSTACFRIDRRALAERRRSRQEDFGDRDGDGQRMQQAADARGSAVGDAWRQLDADWSAHGKMKRQLAPTAGVLRDANAEDPWAKYATSDDISGDLKSAVQGGDMPAIENLSALSREGQPGGGGDGRRQGRPANSKSVEEFRADVFGEQAGQRSTRTSKATSRNKRQARE